MHKLRVKREKEQKRKAFSVVAYNKDKAKRIKEKRRKKGVEKNKGEKELEEQ